MNTPQAVAARAAELLRAGCVLMDLETTGMADDPAVQVIEVAIIDAAGAVLLNTLVRPQGRIPPGASRVNRIYDADVAGKPPFPEVYPQIADLLNGRVVIAYNHEFERGVLRHVCRRHMLPEPKPAEWWCAMRAYATFTGALRYARLGDACRREGIPVANAHRALGDILLTLALVKKMAAAATPTRPTLL